MVSLAPVKHDEHSNITSLQSYDYDIYVYVR